MSDKSNDLLQGLPAEDAAALLSLGVRVDLPSGSVLFRLGDEAESVYLVLRGRVDLTMPMRIRDREEDVLLEEAGPGQMLAWSGLIPPYRLTLKARAAVDSELLALPRSALLAYFEKHPAVGMAVSRNVASVIGQRLKVVQTLWLREMQRMVELRYA